VLIGHPYCQIPRNPKSPAAPRPRQRGSSRSATSSLRSAPGERGSRHPDERPQTSSVIEHCDLDHRRCFSRLLRPAQLQAADSPDLEQRRQSDQADQLHRLRPESNLDNVGNQRERRHECTSRLDHSTLEREQPALVGIGEHLGRYVPKVRRRPRAIGNISKRRPSGRTCLTDHLRWHIFRLCFSPSEASGGSGCIAQVRVGPDPAPSVPKLSAPTPYRRTNTIVRT
jgi:hypothetical protein